MNCYSLGVFVGRWKVHGFLNQLLSNQHSAFISLDFFLPYILSALLIGS